MVHIEKKKKNQLHDFNDPVNNLVHIQPACM